MVRDVVSLMTRHFEAHELPSVVNEIDRLFANRLTQLMDTVQLRVPRLGTGASSNHSQCVHQTGGTAASARPKNQSRPSPQDSQGTQQSQGCGGTTGL
jgi:hypothetical protein